MKFIVSATTKAGEPAASFTFANPDQAVHKWFELGKDYPMSVSIQPNTLASGLAIVIWAGDHFEKLDEWAEKYHCPYKMDWLKYQIADQILKKKVSMQWEYDQISPFCEG